MEKASFDTSSIPVGSLQDAKGPKTSKVVCK
jgi:hypothetical protein